MKEERKRALLHLLRIGCLTIGAAFVFLGIRRGEHLEVLEKAVMLCLECIGIA